MSFKATKIEKNLVRTFLATERADIDKLPTNTTVGTGGLTNIDNDKVAFGSRATCSEDWTRWVLTPDNVWKQIPSGSSGGGGVDGDMDFISNSEIDGIISSLT